jgi:hypothetical protein
METCYTCRKEFKEEEMEYHGDGFVCCDCEDNLPQCDRGCGCLQELHQEWEHIIIENKEETWCEGCWKEFLRMVRHTPEECGDEFCRDVYAHLAKKR